MKSLGLPTTAPLLLAFTVAFAIPVFADVDHLDLHLKFDSAAMQLADNPPPPCFSLSHAVGHVNINDIDNPQGANGTARIVGLQVDFDADVLGGPNCTRVLGTQHYTAHFDDVTGSVSLTDPANPKSLFVTANPTSARVHHTSDGGPNGGPNGNGNGGPNGGLDDGTDTIIRFAQFTYNVAPTVGYNFNFTFFSSEFKANVSVFLSGTQ